MPFTFEISLSVLNHLGRNLYRSFATVLGEAISNAWDADAVNVKIYIDSISNDLVIKDDGIGMTADDFQEKFLKIGYSKRKGGESTSEKAVPLGTYWRKAIYRQKRYRETGSFIMCRQNSCDFKSKWRRLCRWGY